MGCVWRFSSEGFSFLREVGSKVMREWDMERGAGGFKFHDHKISLQTKTKREPALCPPTCSF